MTEIRFVTSNENKFDEAARILGPAFELIQARAPILEIQSMDVRAIVKDKAMKAYERIGKPVVVEDTSLSIRAWNGFPGPLVAWIIKTVGIEGICRLVGKERHATAEACVGFYDGKRLEVFSGKLEGKIAASPRGRDRFDWDRIFIPKGFSKTFAEMSIEEKNRISHRKKAFLRLKRFLDARRERK